MCDLCLTAPCATGCPNAEPRPIVRGRCLSCRDPIRVGDEYVEVGGRVIHLECLENMSTKVLLKTLDYDIKEAQEDDLF